MNKEEAYRHVRDKAYEIFESEESIAKAIEEFKEVSAKSMTPEQYSKLCEWIKTAPKSALNAMLWWWIEGGIKAAENGLLTAKDRLTFDREFRKKFDITETASDGFKTHFLPEPKNDYCVKKIAESNPSDYISLTRDEDLFLCDLWEPSDKHMLDLPSDLFFAHTIPLKDCVISVDERDSDIENGRIVKYRVVIFDEYEKNINWAVVNKKEDSIIIVGAIIPLDVADGNLFMPIMVVKGFDFIVSGGTLGWFSKKAKDCADNDKNTRKMTNQWFTGLYETWYGIQIALLHPAVKDVFANPQRCKTDETKSAGKNRKRKVKYIRKHILTLDKLETVSNSKEARKINRKCLAWYVIGHWRTYKSGKKVFVMPYWKGVLRDLRKNMEGDERERQINFEWETGT